LRNFGFLSTGVGTSETNSFEVKLGLNCALRCYKWS
jgi:hypothetical protein